MDHPNSCGGTVPLTIARDDSDETELEVFWDLSRGRLRCRPTATDAGRPASTGGSAESLSVPLGVWEHRSGKQYLVLGTADDDRGGEPQVIYVRLYSRPGLPVTARRASVFLDSDDAGPRFRWLGDRQAHGA